MADMKKYFDGFLDYVKVSIGKEPARKSKLIDWLKEYDALVAESSELDALKESLPQEIDTLLASGKMDDKTIEILAKKRAHLDLLPARQEKIGTALEKVDKEFEGASSLVEAAVRKATELFYNRQMEAAILDLKQLGVSEEIAKEQALLREDIQAINPWRVNTICNSSIGGNAGLACRLLWSFESFEAGLHPDSKGAQKFKKSWYPNG